MTDRLTDAELAEIENRLKLAENVPGLSASGMAHLGLRLLAEIRRLRAKRLPKEVLVLVSRLRYLTANWGAEGDETAALAGTQAADLLVSLSAQVEATNARAEKAEKDYNKANAEFELLLKANDGLEDTISELRTRLKVYRND